MAQVVLDAGPTDINQVVRVKLQAGFASADAETRLCVRLVGGAGPSFWRVMSDLFRYPQRSPSKHLFTSDNQYLNLEQVSHAYFVDDGKLKVILISREAMVYFAEPIATEVWCAIQMYYEGK